MKNLHNLASQTSMYGINPDDREELIIDDSVALEMVPISNEWIHFISIRALNPGHGKGSNVMGKIIQIVDQCGVHLIGRINPYDKKTMSKEALRGWYKKYKCQPINASNPDGFWVRTPKGEEYKLPRLEKKTVAQIYNGFSAEDLKDAEIQKVFGVVATLAAALFLIS